MNQTKAQPKWHDKLSEGLPYQVWSKSISSSELLLTDGRT